MPFIDWSYDWVPLKGWIWTGCDENIHALVAQCELIAKTFWIRLNIGLFWNIHRISKISLHMKVRCLKLFDIDAGFLNCHIPYYKLVSYLNFYLDNKTLWSELLNVAPTSFTLRINTKFYRALIFEGWISISRKWNMS